MKYAIIGLALLAGCSQEPSELEKRVDELERLINSNTSYTDSISYRMYGFGADLRKLDIKLSKIELYTCEPRTDIGYVWSNCTLQDCTLEPNKTCIIDKNCK